MHDVDTILDDLISRSSCLVSPPAGVPKLSGGLELPSDLQRFYERCGGLVVNKDGECGSWARIVSPDEFQRIDATIMGGEMFASGPFQHWYAIVDVQDGNYLAIDVGREHNGKCLDCFRETFAMPGYVSVIASSFSDLLIRLRDHKEDSAFWLQDDFSSLGEGFELYGIKPLA